MATESLAVEIINLLSRPSTAKGSTKRPFVDENQIVGALTSTERLAKNEGGEIARVLAELTTLGILERGITETEKVYGWRLVDTLPLGQRISKKRDNDPANSDVPPPPGDQGPGDGDFPDGGRGLSEVIAHPILFALNDDDFDLLLDDVLTPADLGPDGGGF